MCHSTQQWVLCPFVGVSSFYFQYKHPILALSVLKVDNSIDTILTKVHMIRVHPSSSVELTGV